MSDLIERLRVAVRNSKATIFGEQISATLGSEAAAALEARDAKIADLEARVADLNEQLSLARERKENARRDINRAMDKHLKDDQS